MENNYQLKKHIKRVHGMEAKLNAGYEMWLQKGLTEAMKETILNWLVKKNYITVEWEKDLRYLIYTK